MATDTLSREAAHRIRDTLNKAKEGKHYNDAWYAYVRRTDVETLVEYVIGPEPVPEPAPEPVEKYTVTVTDSAGNIIEQRDAEPDEIEYAVLDMLPVESPPQCDHLWSFDICLKCQTVRPGWDNKPDPLYADPLYAVGMQCPNMLAHDHHGWNHPSTNVRYLCPGLKG